MKECKYCRSMYEDSLSACPNCGGNKIVTSEERAEEAALKQKEKENRESAIAAPLKMRKNILIGIGVVIAIIITIVAIASINANKPYSDGTTKDEATNLLETGMDYFNSGDYEAAIECFSQLPADSKEYSEAQSMIEKSAEAYRSSILSKADTYVQEEEYDVAIGMMEKALKVLPNDTVLKNEYNKINDLYKKSISDSALSAAKEFVKNNDYENAIKTLQDAITKIGSDEEISAQLDAYKNTYVSSVIDAAKKQYKEYNAPSIFAAEDMIEAALKIVPENQSLLDAYAFYTEHEPVNVIQLLTSNDDNDFVLKEAVKDTAGTVYSNALCGAKYDYVTKDDFGDIWAWQWCYEYIELDYQYSKLTGVFFHNEAYKTAPVETVLIVDGDHLGDTLWMGKVSKNSGVKSFSVDVSQEPNIRIEFSVPNDFISERDPETLEYACIAELYLWK